MDSTRLGARWHSVLSAGAACAVLAAGALLSSDVALAAPTVTAIAPAAGNSTGATPVTVTGSGFVAGATVSIGGVACTQIKVVSGTTIIAVSGAHAAGATTVQVCNPPSDCSGSGPTFTFNSTTDLTKTTKAQFETAGSTRTNLVTVGLDSTLRWIDWTPTTGGSMAASTYYYVVTAINAAGETQHSAQSAGSVVAGANNAVRLDWTPIAGALQYKLYRTIVSGTYVTPSLIATVTAPPYTDVALAPSAGAPPAANTATGDMFLAYGGTPGTTFTAGPNLTGNADFGCFALQRPDGTFFIVQGRADKLTTIYDPVANTMTAGPNLTGNADRGSHSIHRPNGIWLIIHGDVTTTTSLYDPVTNTVSAGPATTAAVGWGGGSIKRPNGTFLIVHANNSTGTSIYDPVANTMSAGPALGGNADEGALSVPRPDGTYLICRGNNGNGTSVYDPVANTMSAGPNLTGNLGRGGHAIQRPDGRWVIVHGNNLATSSLYAPILNTMAAGPAFTANIHDGGHSLQRADGTFLVVIGNNTKTTNVYNPVTNAVSAGPTCLNNTNDGAVSLQRPDGTYLVMSGNSNKTMLYDAGWARTGQYLSENLSPADVNWWNTLSWTRDADDTLAVYLRTATTSGGLAAAAWRAATNGGSIGAAAGEKWLQLRVDYARAITQTAGALDSVWGRWRAEFRRWRTPDVPSLTANYTPTTLSVASSKSTFAYGAHAPNTWIAPDSTTLTNDGTVPARLLGRITQFSDGANNWTVSSTANGVDQIRAQYSTSTAAGPWTDIAAYASDFLITNAVTAGNNLKLYFRIQSPTSTPSTSQHASTLTVTAQ